MKKLFGSYLASFKNEDSPIGDLASDFVRDCKTNGLQPSRYRSAEAVKSRLERMGACPEAFDALQEVSISYVMNATQ